MKYDNYKHIAEMKIRVAGTLTISGARAPYLCSSRSLIINKMKTFEELLEECRNIPTMTKEETKKQTISFVYGNLACSTNHKVTREQVEIEYDKLHSKLETEEDDTGGSINEARDRVLEYLGDAATLTDEDRARIAADWDKDPFIESQHDSKQSMKRVCINLQPDIRIEMDLEAKRLDRPRLWVIRRAVAVYLAKTRKLRSNIENE